MHDYCIVCIRAWEKDCILLFFCTTRADWEDCHERCL